MRFAVVVALASLAVAFGLTPPELPQTYTAEITMQNFPGGEPVALVVHQDATRGARAVISELGSALTYFDEDGRYVLTEQGCTRVEKLDGKELPNLFSWLKHAQFQGQDLEDGRLLNVWSHHSEDNRAVLTLLVDAKTNTPARMTLWKKAPTAGRSTVMTFTRFTGAGAAAATALALPKSCQGTTAATVATIASAPDLAPVYTFENFALGVQSAGTGWQCVACEVAAEAVIAVGCAAGSAVCATFEPACEIICEGGCFAAQCSAHACSAVGFC